MARNSLGVLAVILLFALCLPIWSTQARSQAAPSGTSPQASTTPQASLPNAQDDQKRDLELRKLHAEITKLSAETDKLYWDRVTGWIAPTVSVLTILILAITIVAQRRTALDVQKLQDQHTLELKIAEFIMTSRSPAMAKDRAELLSTLYHGDSREFLDVVRTKAEGHDFPGDIGFELRSRVFEQTALKYNDASDIIELARRIFTGDMWLRDLDTPQRTRSTDKDGEIAPKNPKGKDST
jgi:hypothetical protein